MIVDKSTNDLVKIVTEKETKEVKGAKVEITMGKLFFTSDVFTINLTVDEDFAGLEKWRNRYLRDAPIHIHPNRRNRQTGYTESFTILAENNFSFTFSLSTSLEELRNAEKARKLAL